LTEETDKSDAIRRAQELLADDPKLRYMATIAQSNPKVREAVDRADTGGDEEVNLTA
jgi:hypothetical protein